MFVSDEDTDTIIKKGKAFKDKIPTKEDYLSQQFVKTTFRKLDDLEWRIKNRSKYTVYLYVRRRVVRKSYKGDLHDLYHRYYLDNKLAAMVSTRELAKLFGYKETKMIRQWLKELQEDGAFIIEKIKVGKGQQAFVFVLGEFQATKEIWYYD